MTWPHKLSCSLSWTQMVACQPNPVSKAAVMRCAQSVISGTRPIDLRSALFDEVVEKAVHGGPAEVNRLFRLVQPAIVSFCRSRIGNNAANGDAEDVAQEACASLLAALPKFDRTVSGFLAFAYGIASHKVVDHFRKCGRDRTISSAELIDSVDPAAGPDVLAELYDQSRRMAVLLRALNDRQRDVLAMRIVVGMTSAETAAVTGMTPVAVRVTQRRALILLRAAVADAQVRGNK